MGDTVIAQLQKNVGDLLQKAQREQLQKQQDEKVELLIQLQASGFEKSTAYTNIILLGGYAGAFTLIQATKEFIPDRALIFSALLLAFSVVVFCGWEVAKMIYYAWHNQKVIPLLNKQLSPEEFFRQLRELQNAENQSLIRIGHWWRIVLILSVIPGFSAGAILLYNYLIFLIR